MHHAKAVYDKFINGEHITEEGIKKEMVNHPSHYNQNKWEVVDVLDEFFPKDPLLWNTGKYLLRHGSKGKPLEDLEKAAWYLQRKIEKLRGEL